MRHPPLRLPDSSTQLAVFGVTHWNLVVPPCERRNEIWRWRLKSMDDTHLSSSRRTCLISRAMMLQYTTTNFNKSEKISSETRRSLTDNLEQQKHSVSSDTLKSCHTTRHASDHHIGRKRGPTTLANGRALTVLPKTKR